MLLRVNIVGGVCSALGAGELETVIMESLWSNTQTDTDCEVVERLSGQFFIRAQMRKEALCFIRLSLSSSAFTHLNSHFTRVFFYKASFTASYKLMATLQSSTASVSAKNTYETNRMKAK